MKYPGGGRGKQANVTADTLLLDASRAGEVVLVGCAGAEGGAWRPLRAWSWVLGVVLTFAWSRCCLSPVSGGADMALVGMRSCSFAPGHPWVLVLLVQGEAGITWSSLAPLLAVGNGGSSPMAVSRSCSPWL